MTNRIHYKFYLITGVSGEKVEVDPVGSKGAKFFKQRAMQNTFCIIDLIFVIFGFCTHMYCI
jgi:hypothetical protein